MQLTEAELVRRLLVATVMGGLLGAERELRRKSAGFRTNILIALGSAIFTIMSLTIAPNVDPSRIAAQIVTGIGFLGAGTILRYRDRVHGLTTAATIWVNAALGMAAGAGEYELAALGGAFTLGVLLLLGPLESFVERKVGAKRPD